MMSAVPDLFDPNGQIAPVTGAPSGPGFAIAETMAQAGIDVALLDINADAPAQIAARIYALGRRALTLVAEEIKGTASYQASQASSLVHGATPVIDGRCIAT